MTPLLEVRDLKAGYGPVEVLHGFDLDVNDGEVVVVLGANGAGKTTTIRAISGTIARRGEVSFAGTSIGHASPDAIVRAGVAQVPQGRGTFMDLTVEDNLRVGAYVRHDDPQADIDRWFDVFPRLKERSSQKAGSLSGGEQQMLAIARALMSRPRLLLLDEPSLGLAPLIVRAIFEIIRDLHASGVTILLVEQNAALALQTADRGYVLEAGRLTMAGRAADLLGDSRVRQAYLG